MLIIGRDFHTRFQQIAMLDPTPVDRGVGPGRTPRSRTPPASGRFDEAGRRGAANGVGVCADDRAGEPLSEQQESGELSGAESERSKLGWSATVGCHQQTGQLDNAGLADGSRPDSLPVGSRMAAGRFHKKRGTALDATPGSRGTRCAKKTFDNADDVIHGSSLCRFSGSSAWSKKARPCLNSIRFPVVFHGLLQLSRSPSSGRVCKYTPRPKKNEVSMPFGSVMWLSWMMFCGPRK
jgi:hypothetical protein